MDSGIVIAILSLIGTLSGSFLGVIQSNRVTMVKIEELTKKVEKHNGLVERMVVVEQSSKSAHHRIDSMEKRACP